MDLNLAYILIVLGLGLMAGELFFPTGGVLFLFAGVSVIAGVVLTFLYGDMSTALITLVVVFFAVPLVMYSLYLLWPRTRFGQAMLLGPDDATLARMPVNLELEALRGRHGRALSELRPAGAVEFDGKRVDVISESLLIPVGAWVRCIDVRAGRVVVRQVEKPDLEGINLDDLR